MKRNGSLMQASRRTLAVLLTLTIISAGVFLAGYRQAGYISLTVIVCVGLAAQFIAAEIDARQMRRDYRPPVGSEIPRTRRFIQ